MIKLISGPGSKSSPPEVMNPNVAHGTQPQTFSLSRPLFRNPQVLASEKSVLSSPIRFRASSSGHRRPCACLLLPSLSSVVTFLLDQIPESPRAWGHIQRAKETLYAGQQCPTVLLPCLPSVPEHPSPTSTHSAVEIFCLLESSQLEVPGYSFAILPSPLQ